MHIIIIINIIIISSGSRIITIIISSSRITGPHRETPPPEVRFTGFTTFELE